MVVLSGTTGEGGEEGSDGGGLMSGKDLILSYIVIVYCLQEVLLGGGQPAAQMQRLYTNLVAPLAQVAGRAVIDRLRAATSTHSPDNKAQDVTKPCHIAGDVPSGEVHHLVNPMFLRPMANRTTAGAAAAAAATCTCMSAM
jgi:hypothetical protein